MVVLFLASLSKQPKKGGGTLERDIFFFHSASGARSRSPAPSVAKIWSSGATSRRCSRPMRRKVRFGRAGRPGGRAGGTKSDLFFVLGMSAFFSHPRPKPPKIMITTIIMIMIITVILIITDNNSNKNNNNIKTQTLYDCRFHPKLFPT